MYPLKPPPKVDFDDPDFDNDDMTQGIDVSGGCTLCGKSVKQVSMRATECCLMPVCDTEGDYVMFSFSREHCSRSHGRYTLCGDHGGEKECEKDKDWRECQNCTSERHGGSSHGPDVADTLWRGLNPYNFYPMLATTVPRHSLCETCTKCHEKFISGLEGSSYSFPGGMTCLRCGSGGMGKGMGM